MLCATASEIFTTYQGPGAINEDRFGDPIKLNSHGFINTLSPKLYKASRAPLVKGIKWRFP